MPPRKLRRSTKRPTRKSRRTKSSPGPAFADLVSVMARLRSPGGCPWDREQTHSTLRTYLIEEAYEVLDALDSGDDARFAEELGDLLLQVLFHAQIASEENRFDISDVIHEIHEKMIRRHPHVFGTTRAKTAAEVLHNWEVIKRQERESNKATLAPASISPTRHSPLVTRHSESFTSSTSSTSFTSTLDGIPRTLPALLEAFQLTRKAARIGFDWDNIDGIFDKLSEETAELRHELQKEVKDAKEVNEVKDTKRDGLRSESFTSSTSFTSLTSPRSFSSTSVEAEVGDLLFVVVNLARFLHIDPEIALKKTNSKFTRRFHAMERLAHEQGTTLAQVPRPQLESLWDQAKTLEREINTRTKGRTGGKGN